MSDTATLTDLSLAFVRRVPVKALPPPEPVSGAAVWLRKNLLSTPFNVALTIVCLLLIAWVVPPLLKFLVIDAVWQGTGRADCLVTPERPEVGACWAFVIERIGFFNPIAKGGEERLRVDLGRVDHWVARGAQPSERVTDLLKQYRATAKAA